MTLFENYLYKIIKNKISYKEDINYEINNDGVITLKLDLIGKKKGHDVLDNITTIEKLYNQILNYHKVNENGFKLNGSVIKNQPAFETEIKKILNLKNDITISDLGNKVFKVTAKPKNLMTTSTYLNNLIDYLIKEINTKILIKKNEINENEEEKRKEVNKIKNTFSNFLEFLNKDVKNESNKFKTTLTHKNIKNNINSFHSKLYVKNNFFSPNIEDNLKNLENFKNELTTFGQSLIIDINSYKNDINTLVTESLLEIELMTLKTTGTIGSKTKK